MRPGSARSSSAVAARVGIAWPIPWCGRAWLKYATYARSTRRRWAWPRTRRWSRHSRRTLPRKRSQVALARGARTGVRRTRIPLAAATGITELRTAYRAPRQNATCERFLGSVRRECLDHLLVLGETQLRRVLREYVRYFNDDRPHQGIAQQIPAGSREGPTPVATGGNVQAILILGGLHHTYARAA